MRYPAILLLSMLVAVWPAIGVSQTSADASPDSLRKLPGVEVIVDELSPDVERSGLMAAQLRSAIEQRMRKAGVRILTSKERLAISSSPYVHLRVSTLHDLIGRYFVCIEFELRRQVLLAADEETPLSASTWELPTMIRAVADDRVRDIEMYVERMVDKFLEAYLLVNPR